MSNYQYPDMDRTTPPDNSTLGQKLVNPSHWLRLLLMFLMYLILFTLIQFIVTISMLVQWILVLFNGSANMRLRAFTKSLNRYSWEILEYLNFNSDRAPFPLADWPETND